MGADTWPVPCPQARPGGRRLDFVVQEQEEAGTCLDVCLCTGITPAGADLLRDPHSPPRGKHVSLAVPGGTTRRAPAYGSCWLSTMGLTHSSQTARQAFNREAAGPSVGNTYSLGKDRPLHACAYRVHGRVVGPGPAGGAGALGPCPLSDVPHIRVAAVWLDGVVFLEPLGRLIFVCLSL